jgi:cysteinyl-tRNA synthetase
VKPICTISDLITAFSEQSISLQAPISTLTAQQQTLESRENANTADAMRDELEMKGMLLEQVTNALSFKDTQMRELMQEVERLRSVILSAEESVYVNHRMEEQIQQLECEKDVLLQNQRKLIGRCEEQLKLTWTKPWSNLIKVSTIGGWSIMCKTFEFGC